MPTSSEVFFEKASLILSKCRASVHIWHDEATKVSCGSASKILNFV